MHQKLIADVARFLGVSEEMIFVKALTELNDSIYVNERAKNDYLFFKSTGMAPAYVESYALRKLTGERHQLAQRLVDESTSLQDLEADSV